MCDLTLGNVVNMNPTSIDVGNKVSHEGDQSDSFRTVPYPRDGYTRTYSRQPLPTNDVDAPLSTKFNHDFAIYEDVFAHVAGVDLDWV